MKTLQTVKYAAIASIGTVAITAIGSISPAEAATITTGAGGGVGLVPTINNPVQNIHSLLDNPEAFLQHLSAFNLKGIAYSESKAVGAANNKSSSQIGSGDNSAKASISFNNNSLTFKTYAKGTASNLLAGETAVGYAAAVLKDTPTLSALGLTGSGFYQLRFDLTGNGVSRSPGQTGVSTTALGALVIRNNGELVLSNGYQPFSSAQSFDTGLIPIEFGQAFNLDIAFASAVAADCFSDQPCSGSYSATADFYDTLTLAGIDVYDADKNQIDEFTFTSDSGIQYASATTPEQVPAPSLLIGAVGLLGTTVAKKLKGQA